MRPFDVDLITVAAFLEWSPHPAGWWQLVDGIPVAMAPSSPAYGALQAEIARLIGNHLLSTPACRVVTEPGVIPRLQADINFRIPDLMVTCSPVDVQDWALIEPKLIVEVLSSGNRAQTWANVWTYTTVPSVEEICIVYADRVEARVVRRLQDGSWPDGAEQVLAGTTLALRSIGFEAPIGSFYRQTGLRQG